ncbi:hypothetical protein, partial [Halorubrum distributum]|uniref:hypothetical protein n=1 Tax=Halorubrum distributum TaxID=29283 RepID=UPI0019D32308
VSDTADAVSLSSSTRQRQLASINNLLRKSEESIPIRVRTRRDKFWWLTAVIALTAALTFITRFLFEPIMDLGLIRELISILAVGVALFVLYMEM